MADKHSYEGSQKMEILENVFVSKNEIEYEVDERGFVSQNFPIEIK